MSIDAGQKGRILVCSSCRRDGEGKEVPFPQRAGGRLARLVREAVRTAGLPLKVETCRCLGVCDLHKQVGVVIDGRGKDTIVMGDVTPDAAGAEMVLRYAKAHVATHKRVRTKKHVGADAVPYYVVRVPALR